MKRKKLLSLKKSLTHWKANDSVTRFKKKDFLIESQVAVILTMAI